MLIHLNLIDCKISPNIFISITQINYINYFHFKQTFYLSFIDSKILDY